MDKFYSQISPGSGIKGPDTLDVTRSTYILQTYLSNFYRNWKWTKRSSIAIFLITRVGHNWIARTNRMPLLYYLCMFKTTAKTCLHLHTINFNHAASKRQNVALKDNSKTSSTPVRLQQLFKFSFSLAIYIPLKTCLLEPAAVVSTRDVAI